MLTQMEYSSDLHTVVYKNYKQQTVKFLPEPPDFLSLLTAAHILLRSASLNPLEQAISSLNLGKY